MDLYPSLRAELDRYLEGLFGLQHRYLAGLSAEWPTGQIYAGFPRFSDPESFSAVRDEPWREFLARQVLEAAAARPAEEAAALEAQGETALSDERVTWREARARVGREPAPARRAAVASQLGGFLLSHRGPYARRVEAMLEAPRRLGRESTTSLRASLGRPDAVSLEDCGLLLSSTRDAYCDVLGFLLKRLDPPMKAPPHGDAGWQDLERAAQTPWLLGQLSAGECLPSATRCLSALGFHPTAEGRIRLETDEREGKAAAADAIPVQVPNEVRLLARLHQGGQAEYAGLLFAWGKALRLAHLPPDAPVETRRLWDAAAVDGWGLFFGRLLTLEEWHRRLLSASRPQGREAARVCALFALARLREACARRLYLGALEQLGPGVAAADEFAQRMGEALQVEVHRGFYLRDLGSLLTPDAPLKACALSEALLGYAESHFGEDFFRNPACGAWLRSAWRSAEREEAGELLGRVGQERFDLVSAGRRLVRVLGA